MRDYADISLKGPEDILECLQDGHSAYDIYELHGDYVAGMIANVCDNLFQQLNEIKHAVHESAQLQVEGPGARSLNEIKRTGAPWVTRADLAWLLELAEKALRDRPTFGPTVKWR